MCRSGSEESRREGKDLGTAGAAAGMGGAGDGEACTMESRLLDEGGGGGRGGAELGFEGAESEALIGGGGGLLVEAESGGIELGLDGGGEGDVLNFRGVGSEALCFFVEGGGGLRLGMGGGGGGVEL